MGFWVEAFQVSVMAGPHRSNLEQISSLVGGSKADLCVFPEAATSGFDYEGLAEIAAMNERFLPEVAKLAADRQRWILLPMLVQESGGFFNRQRLLGPDGRVVRSYDKLHLIGVLNEDRFLRPGENGPVVAEIPTEAGPLRVGLATCYDLRFPELFRDLVLHGLADLLIVPAMWPASRIEHFKILAQARAIENLTPLIACNAVGACGNLMLGGASLVIGAFGEVLGSASGDKPASLTYEWTKEPTEKTRREFPVLQDVRGFSGWSKPEASRKRLQ